MKIILTGGAGFIGSHIVDRYISEGHEVVVVDDLSFGKIENVNPRAQFYKTDIANFDEVLAIFEKENPEIINHHAALASITVSTRDPNITFRTNVLGTLNLVEAAFRVKTKKFIFASTGGALYGDVDHKIIPVSEDTPAHPLSPYGLSKLIAERSIAALAPLDGMRYVIFRYGNVFGPRQDPNGEAGVVAIFIGKILKGETPTIFGDGLKTRDYIYVDDVVEANVKALPATENGIYHISWGKEITDRQVFDAVTRALGKNLQPHFAEKRPGEVYRIALSRERALKTLEWQPRISFAEGVKRTVEYFTSR